MEVAKKKIIKDGQTDKMSYTADDHNLKYQIKLTCKYRVDLLIKEYINE